MMLFLGFILFMFGLFMVFMTLDRWSTLTLLNFNQVMMKDEELRKKWYDYNTTIGNHANELNPLPRFFMQKYGTKKGLFIHALVYNIPFLGIIFLAVWFEIFPAIILYTMLSFYVGALYLQIFRAYTVSKRCKAIGINIGGDGNISDSEHEEHMDKRINEILGGK
jgi:hypothetical protein